MLCISKLPCVPQQPQSAGEHIGAGTHLAASPLPSPCQGGSLKSEAAAVPRHPGQSGHQIISTLPSAQHLYPEFKPHEARSKISEAREKELPAALQQIPAPHGLTARLQPSSLQAPISPPGTLQLLSAGGLQRIHELLGSVQLRQEKRDFFPPNLHAQDRRFPRSSSPSSRKLNSSRVGKRRCK